MNEEFYGIIKLVSGEEIFSKVCAFEEKEEILLVLDHPVFVETSFVPKLGVPVAKVNPWMKLTEESTFIINRNTIITITEVKDETMIRMHKRYVKETKKSSNQAKITPNMGYISTVEEARVSLEKLYKINSTSRTQD